MTDPASLSVHIGFTGLDRNEAANVLTTAFPGSRVTFDVTQPALGGRRYAADIRDLSVGTAFEVLGQLRTRWSGEEPLPQWERELLAEDDGPAR